MPPKPACTQTGLSPEGKRRVIEQFSRGKAAFVAQPARLVKQPLAAIKLFYGSGASGAFYIQGIVFFRAGHVPVGVGDLLGLGGRL